MTYSECLKKLSLCLKAMLEDCQEKNWESLYNNEKEREKLNASLKSLKPNNSKENIQLLKTVIELNNAVIASADNNKNDSEKALLEIKRNMKKTAKYYSE